MCSIWGSVKVSDLLKQFFFVSLLVTCTCYNVGWLLVQSHFVGSIPCSPVCFAYSAVCLVAVGHHSH